MMETCRDQISVSKSNMADIFQCRQNQSVDRIEDDEDDDIDVDIEEDDDHDVDIENDDNHRKTTHSTSTKVAGDKFSIDSLLRHKQTSTSAGTTLSNVINNNKSVEMSTILVKKSITKCLACFLLTIVSLYLSSVRNDNYFTIPTVKFGFSKLGFSERSFITNKTSSPK